MRDGRYGYRRIRARWREDGGTGEREAGRAERAYVSARGPRSRLGLQLPDGPAYRETQQGEAISRSRSVYLASNRPGPR